MPQSASHQLENYLSRQEFEQFERTVHSGFDDVRRAINTIGAKLDGIVARGTDWKAIFSALSVVISVIGSIGGITAWGLLSKIDGTSDLLRERMSTSEKMHEERMDSNRQRIAQLEEGFKKVGENMWTKFDHEQYTDSGIKRIEAIVSTLLDRVRAAEAAIAINMESHKVSR